VFFMAEQRLIHLTSIDELRLAASAWDELWWRSEVSLPTVRAELLAQWLEEFAPGREFHALAVEENGRWVAALPLISRRLAGILPVGSMPYNSWSSSGELLLDPAADTAAALDVIVAATGKLSWQLLWLDETIVHTSRWRTFIQACDRAFMATSTHDEYQVARIETSRDWDFFLKSLSRTHRQATNKAVRRLNDLGNVRFEMKSQLEPQDVKPWLEKVFDVEDRSWKGVLGSSVYRTPGMFEFLLRQAEQLARWGQLEIATLELERHVLAALYGYSAKGIYYAHKIGYDPKYAEYSPGQVLFWHVLKQLHADGKWQALDTLGPLSEAISRWRPATYTMSRVAVAPRRMVGRVAMHAYQNWWPAVQRMRDSLRGKVPETTPVDSPVSEPLGVPG
jgi:CelD/BcsL family acetyltransferase involved in cellulose biosynthesis